MDNTSVANDLDSFRQFLNEICETFTDKCEENESVPIRLPNPRLTVEELEGECLDWCLNFLSTRKCPSVLAAHIARDVYVHVSNSDLDEFLTDDVKNGRIQAEGDGTEKQNGRNEEESPGESNKCEDILTEYCSERLHQFVMSRLEDVCKSWQTSCPDIKIPERLLTTSCHAIKNTRRKMEDFHVIVPDLNSLFGLKGEPCQSFYGVFDGHAGVDASQFTSKHIHCNLVHKCPLGKNPEEASRGAFKVTDDMFIPKAKRERWRSGTTGVTALVRDNKLYLTWLGDSQACLVRDGKVVSHMEPHKPEREDERDRIQSQGGFVLMVGDLYRVGGNLAVSRAIGDVAYKPFVSSDAEVLTYDLDGTEDYVVLACDGLWDIITEEEVPRLIYNYLTETGGDKSSLAKYLVQFAKDNDSTDNISVVVVFFRDKIAEPSYDAGLFNFLSSDSQGTNQSGGGDTDNSKDKSDGANNDSKGDNSKKSMGPNGKPSDSHKDGEEFSGGYSDENREMEKATFDIVYNSAQDVGDDSAQLKHNNQGFRKPALSREVDLDYYGVFNTRLVDGPIDLSFIDDQNSSILLKDIADEVLNNSSYPEDEFEDCFDEQLDFLPMEHLPENYRDKMFDRIKGQPKKKAKKNRPVPAMIKKEYNKKGLANSPICWAFTGKNKATVQNHRLNLTAKNTFKSSNPTLGELTLAAKAPPILSEKPPNTKLAPLNTSSENVHVSDIANVTMSHGKLEALLTARAKVYNNPVSSSNSGFTVFGSKASFQPEMKKFHTSWRPRKPLKPITTIVYETPPTPFMNSKLNTSRQH